jgi:hypothetical protein
MPADRSYITGNDKERARLKAIVARSSDAELARPMPAGWTVAGVLLHAAFWDQRIIVLLGLWQGQGIEPRPELAEDVAWMNDSMKPLLLAVAPRKAAEVAVAIAEETDALVAKVSDALIARNIALGDAGINLSRADHRGEHLEDIERVLGG